MKMMSKTSSSRDSDNVYNYYKDTSIVLFILILFGVYHLGVIKRLNF